MLFRQGFLLAFVVCILSVQVAQTSTPTTSSTCPVGSNWTGKKCVCPRPKIMLNGKCICDYGYLNRNGSCLKCDATNASNGINCLGGNIQLPDGYIWNIISNTTQQNWNSSNCGNNSYWNGFSCTTPFMYPIVCRPGYIWNNVSCVLNATGCSFSSYWNGRNCVNFVNPPVCMVNFTWDALTQSCISKSRAVKCPVPLLWNGAFCSRWVTDGRCNAGNYWNGMTCILWNDTNGYQVCATGYVWAGRRCINSKGKKVCDQAYTLVATANMCLLVLCQPGRNYDLKKKICISISEPILSLARSPRTSAGTLGTQFGIIAGQTPNIAEDISRMFLEQNEIDSIANQKDRQINNQTNSIINESFKAKK